jgi:hypothetical protein
MITFQEEKAETCLEDIRSLIEQAWEEVGHGSLEKVSPVPNWETYRKLENNNAVVALTVRDDDKLVGYCTLFFYDALHHSGRKKSSTDSLYLKREYRGMTGLEFIQEAKKIAYAHGAEELCVQVTERVNFGRMLEKLGFSLQYYTYGMRLKNA